MQTKPRLLSLALVSALALTVPATFAPTISHAAVWDVSITVAPPPLPVYDQPPMPDVGYIWMPGYWAWSDAGYYWVAGTWVLPPQAGLLWTPGYWSWDDGRYLWNAGYWGPTVGFYGGIDYGFGYPGDGYYGGHWDHDHFFYNRAANNFGSVRVVNIYNEALPAVSHARVSFNGGRDGIAARPTPEQVTFARERHVDPTPAQVQHEQTASRDHTSLASTNHGAPAIAATPRPGTFSGGDVVHARGGDTAAADRNTAPSAVTRSAPDQNARAQAPVGGGPLPAHRDVAAAPAVQPHPAAMPNRESAAAQSSAMTPQRHEVAAAPVPVARPAAPPHVAAAPAPHPAAPSRVAAAPAAPPRPASVPHQAPAQVRPEPAARPAPAPAAHQAPADHSAPQQQASKPDEHR